MKIINTILCVFLLFLAGCTTTNVADRFGYEKKSNIERRLNEAKEEYEKRLKEQEITISNKKDEIIASKQDQITAASNSFYAADLVFETIVSPVRTDIITNNYVNEGWAALGYQMPTYEKMMEINQRLKDELDEAKTSLEDLKKTNDRIIGENKELADKTSKLNVQLEEEKRRANEIKEEYHEKIQKLNNELNEANAKIISLERKRADDSDAIKAAKTKLSWGAGVLAALCIIGAVFSPLFKEKFGLGAFIFGLAAVGIWYLTPLVVLTFLGAGFALIVGWTLLNHNKTTKTLSKEKETATDIYRAIQRFKESRPEEYKFLKPILEDANTKYVDKNGAIVKELDAERIQFIDKRLADVGDK